jgi:membrane fusion protein, multidrug efflux system
MKKLIIIAALAALLAIGIIPRIMKRRALDEAHASLLEPRVVTTVDAKRASAGGKLALPGAALPFQSGIIYARVNGFVRELRADLGDHVSAGQVLAVLDTPELQSDLVSARARAAENDRNAKLAHATSERYGALSESGVASKQQADETSARANSAESAAATARSEVERIETMLAFRQVTAPFSGVITRRGVERGSLVTAGSSAGITALYEIARIDTLKVFIDVPQSLAGSISIGDPAEVAAGGKSISGKVARTSGALDPATRTLRTEVHVPGDKGILSGSFVRVTLTTHDAEPPVLVPANAVVSRSGKNFLFTVDGDVVREHPIAIGRELGATVEVTSGLLGNEKIVINPAETLADSEKVRVRSESGR